MKRSVEKDGRTYLAIPYKERAEAIKAAGKLPNGANALGFDDENKAWYAKDGANLERLKRWLPEQAPQQRQARDYPSEFREALEASGFVMTDAPEMDGKWHRVPTQEDKPGQKSGSYKAFLDGVPAGIYQDYRHDDKPKKWVADGEQSADPSQLVNSRAIAAQRRSERAQRLALQIAHNAKRAAQLYALLPDAEDTQRYLQEKGVKAVPGVKTDKKERLVIPLQDEEGQIKSFQRISGTGFKSLKKNAEKQGNFFVVGGELTNGRPILYAEGYSTAASINEATGRPVVMTVDAGNLPRVAEKLSSRYPDSTHIALGDDDRNNKINKGLDKAIEAAELTKGGYAVPMFNKAEIDRGLSDFNDLHQSRGLAEVRSQVEAAISHLTKVKSMESKDQNDTAPIVTEKFDKDIEAALGAAASKNPTEQPKTTTAAAHESDNTVEPAPEKSKTASADAAAKAWLASSSRRPMDKLLEQADRESPFPSTSYNPEPSTTADIASPGKPKKQLDEVFQTTTLKPVVPEKISKSYIEVDGKFYFQNKPDSLAFIDKGAKLQTKLSTPQVASAMVDMAEARGWTQLQLKGTDQFRREAWLAAASRGLDVKGYTPKEEDLARLTKMAASRPINEVQTGRQNDNSETTHSHQPTDTSPKDKSASSLQPEAQPSNRLAGTLIDHGKAPYEHKPDNRPSYYVTLENASGEKSTTWGVDLERAIQASKAQRGEKVELENLGRQPVQIEKPIKDDTGQIVDKETINTYRNKWDVKAEAILDKERPAREVLREHPDLVNEIAQVKVAEKFARSLAAADQERFMEKVRAKVASNISNGHQAPEIRLKEEREIQQTKEKDNER